MPARATASGRPRGFLSPRLGVPRAVFLSVGVLAVAACGGPKPPPGPGTVMGFAPSLVGQRVMVLPVQSNLGVRGDPDAELAFGLRERDVEVEWVMPAEVQEVLDRSPGVRTRLNGLAVGQFLVAEVRRIGDPLYGQLRRLAALVDAQVAVVPVQVALATENPGGAQSASTDPTVRVWTALIDIRTGQVRWFSILDGEAFPAGDPRGLASAMEMMTRTLLWYSDT